MGKSIKAKAESFYKDRKVIVVKSISDVISLLESNASSTWGQGYIAPGVYALATLSPLHEGEKGQAFVCSGVLYEKAYERIVKA